MNTAISTILLAILITVDTILVIDKIEDTQKQIDTLLSQSCNCNPVPGDSGYLPPTQNVSGDAPFYIKEMETTGYCLCDKCCGVWATKGIDDNGQRITASGKPAKGPLVAGPPNLPFGTFVSIPGYEDGRKVEVLDRGGAIQGDRLDLLFEDENGLSGHQRALNYGRQRVFVTVYRKEVN